MAASASKQTLPAVGPSPTAGCGVASQPASVVPHAPEPGAFDGMRLPVPSVYQPSCRLSHWPGVPDAGVELTSRHGSLSGVGAVCGQPAWHIDPGTIAGDHGGGAGGGSSGGGPMKGSGSTYVLVATSPEMVTGGANSHVGTSGGGKFGGGGGGGEGGGVEGSGGDGGGSGGGENGLLKQVLPAVTDPENIHVRPLSPCGHGAVEMCAAGNCVVSLSGVEPLSGFPPCAADRNCHASFFHLMP